MSFTEQQVAALEAKLDASHVKQREQSGRKLSYIEGWQAISEANRIFGFDGWDRETVELRQFGEPFQDAKNLWRVSFMAKVRVRVRTSHPETITSIITREGCGYGSGIARDFGDAHESAVKEAETDAMKRALMTFGNPFGLALYDKTQENVERNGKGFSRSAPPKRTRAEISEAAAFKTKTHDTLISDLRGIETEEELDAYVASHLGPDVMSRMSNGQFLIEEMVEAKRQELREDVALAPSAQTRAEYIQQCHDKIAEGTTPNGLRAWWNGEQMTRRRFSLKQAEVNTLLERLKERIGELDAAPHGRDAGGRAMAVTEAG